MERSKAREGKSSKKFSPDAAAIVLPALLVVLFFFFIPYSYFILPHTIHTYLHILTKPAPGKEHPSKHLVFFPTACRPRVCFSLKSPVRLFASSFAVLCLFSASSIVSSRQYHLLSFCRVFGISSSPTAILSASCNTPPSNLNGPYIPTEWPPELLTYLL